nr:hypothetical protein [Streptomyces sp. NRRL S-340]
MPSHPAGPRPRLRLPLWTVPVLWTVLLGLWGLSRGHSVGRDEAATWLVAQRSTGEIWHTLQHVDAVHGLYHLWMHALFGCFGPGITTLRLPSVLAMAAAAACVTVVGCRLRGTRTGLVGGLALALLPAIQFQRRLHRDGDAVLFVPAFRRDTALVSPGDFAGLRDIALVRGPAESGTLGGEEADPATIHALTLAERRVLLVTDASLPPGPAPLARDDAKLAALRAHFTVVADERVRGRRVTVYERRSAGSIISRRAPRTRRSCRTAPAARPSAARRSRGGGVRARTPPPRPRAAPPATRAAPGP